MNRVYLTKAFKALSPEQLGEYLDHVLNQLQDQINAGSAVTALTDKRDAMPEGIRRRDLVFDISGGELRVGVFDGKKVVYADFGSFSGTITDAQHGPRSGGTLHPVVTSSSPGFMSVTMFEFVGALPTFTIAGDHIYASVNGNDLQLDNESAIISEVTASSPLLVDGTLISNGATLLFHPLPAACSVGARLSIVGKGVGGWRVTQASGQQIHSSPAGSSTVGVGGSLSGQQFDSVELICIVANTEFLMKSNHGGHLII